MTEGKRKGRKEAGRSESVSELDFNGHEWLARWIAIGNKQ